MKYILVLISFILLSHISVAQNRSLEISLGSNFHGTGDSKGFSFFTEYSKKFKSRWIWANSFGCTINDITEVEIINQNPTTGQRTNSSIYDVKPGIQIVSHIGYSLLKSTSHDLQIRIGGLARYQTTSLPGWLQILYPAGTGLPYVVTVFDNSTPRRTLAIGASSQIKYCYGFKNKINVGIIAGFQLDSNGDVIRQTLLSVGKRF